MKRISKDKKQRLEAEQAERAAEDARLREPYPLPEDEEDYDDENFETDLPTDDLLGNEKDNEVLSQEENAVIQNSCHANLYRL